MVVSEPDVVLSEVSTFSRLPRMATSDPEMSWVAPGTGLRAPSIAVSVVLTSAM